VEVRVLEGEEIREARSDWIALLPDARWAFFLRPEWCHLTWEAFAPGARNRLHVALDDGRVMGILPTSTHRMNRFGLFLPVTEGFAGARGDYSTPICGHPPRRDVVRALLDSALDSARDSGTLILSNLPVETGVPTLVDEFLSERGLLYQRREAHTSWMPVPQTIAEAEAGMKKKLRTDVRRQIRRLEEAVGPIRLHVVTHRDEARALLPDMFEMHDRRWLAIGVPRTFSDPAARGHYEKMVAELWDQGIHFSVLYAGDRAVAFHFGMVCAGFLLYYKPTFDPELQAYSPGKIHLRFLLDDAVARGLRGIDFLQGAEGYKQDWTSQETECVSFLIRTRPLSPSHAWLTRGRPWLEQRVGPLYNRWSARIQAVLRRGAQS